jgi:hypothetical protein
MKNTQSRISVKNRRALVAPATALSKAGNFPVNMVISAVLWRGERLAGRMSLKALNGIVTAGTVAEYQAEIARRAAARQAQIVGMVKTALASERRTSENIGAILRAIGKTAGRSISQIRVQIREAVIRLNLGANVEAGAAG